MTDEEIFNEWKSKQYKDQSTEEKMEFVEHLHTFPQYFKKTFLAGYKAGREIEKEYVKNNAFTSMKEQGLFPFGKWHNLRKDPNDLPLVNSTALDENGDKIEYIGYGKWQVYSEYYERYIEVDPPIAWCEIPKFEE